MFIQKISGALAPPCSRDAHARGEDWSAELSDDALIAHVRNQVDHYLSVAVIEHVQREFRTLLQALDE